MPEHLVPCWTEATDGQLLARFAADRDEEAFATLVKRHGGRVLAVARRILRHRQDAEDVFQATFLILARKAGEVRWQPSVGNWLHEVACRLAREARSRRAEQRAREGHAAERAARREGRRADLAELAALLDEEMLGLPPRQRQVVMLCYYAGQTREETARQLGCSLRTVERRLQQARQRLRERLARHDVTFSGAVLALRLGQSAGEVLPRELAARAVRSAVAGAGREGTSVAVSGEVADLVASGMKMMGGGMMGWMMNRVAPLVLACLGVGLLSAGTLAWGTRSAPPPAPGETPPAERPADRGGVTPKARPAVPHDVLGDPLPSGAVARLGTVRLRHGGLVPTIAFSPDGKLLASGGDDGLVRLWDPSTGKETDRLDAHDHGAKIRCVAFSPDGKRLATAASDKLINLWWVDAIRRGTGHEDKSMHLSGHEGDVQALAFAPDGKTLASGGWDSSVRIWDVGSGKQVRRLGADKGNVRAVAFSPDGKVLASAHFNGRWGAHTSAIQLWDPRTGRHLRRLGPVLERKEIHKLAFSPDGGTLAAAADDQLRLYEVATGKEVSRGLRAHGGAYGVAFAPDGKTVAFGSSSGLRLVDVATGKAVCTFEGDQRYCYTVAFSPDGETIAASGTRSIGLWDRKGRLRHAFVGHPGEVGALAFGPDDSLITGGYGPKLHRWDARTGKWLGTLEGDKDWNKTLALSPDGKLLVVPGPNLILRVLDASTGRVVRLLEGHRPRKGITARAALSAVFSPDGRTLLSAVATPLDGTIRFWDVASGKEVRRFEGRKRGPNHLALSPDGHILAAGFWDGAVWVWDVKTGTVLRKLNPGSNGPALPTFSPDGRTLAVANGGTISLVEVATGKVLRKWSAHKGVISDLAFSPTGHTLVCASKEDPRVMLWEVATGQLRWDVSGHDGPVMVVAFSPDGNLLATGSDDTTALVWDWDLLPLWGQRPDGNLSAKQLDQCWADLAGDAEVAYRALCRLLQVPKQAVPLARERLGPVQSRKLARLIADLDADTFAVREKASEELALLGPEAEAALRAALKKGPSPEARVRIRRLLERLGKPGGGTHGQWRRLRAVELLERLGTPEAREVLEKLADGTPELVLTREAKAAVARLAGRRRRR